MDIERDRFVDERMCSIRIQQAPIDNSHKPTLNQKIAIEACLFVPPLFCDPKN